MADGKQSARDLKNTRSNMSQEALAGQKGAAQEKNRRRKSVSSSQFAHPITGESLKERQVQYVDF